MKKVLILVLILSLSMVLVACGTKKTELEMVREKVSYEEGSVLVGDNEGYRVEVINIKGEEALTIDGKVGNVTERCIVRLSPKSIDSLPDKYIVTLKAKDMKSEVTLMKDVLGMSYTANLSPKTLGFVPTDIDVMVGDSLETIQFTNVLSKAKVDTATAIESAYNTLKESIAKDFDKGEYNGEVVVKLIHSKKMADSPYYYYVSFIRNSDEYASCLIDPNTGNIVNKKIK